MEREIIGENFEKKKKKQVRETIKKKGRKLSHNQNYFGTLK